MGTCHSSNPPTNSSDQAPYDFHCSSETCNHVQSSPPLLSDVAVVDKHELVLCVQPFTSICASYSTREPQFPTLVKMSQLTEKCTIDAGKSSQLARLSSRLPKFTFTRKVASSLQPPPSSSSTMATSVGIRKDKLSSSSSLSSAEPGSSNASCKSSESLTIRKPRLGSHNSDKHFKTSTATIANPGALSCSVSSTTTATSTNSNTNNNNVGNKSTGLYSNNVKPKSTSSLIRPKSLLSRYQSKVSPQPSKVNITKSSSDQECSSRPTSKTPLRFTTAITTVSKPQVAQLVLTNAVNSQPRKSPLDKGLAQLPKKSPISGAPASSSFGYKASNSYNPYKRNQPPITKRVTPTLHRTEPKPATTIMSNNNTATNSTVAPKLITRSSGSLMRDMSKQEFEAGRPTTARLQLPMPVNKLSFTSQLNYLPTFGRLNGSKTVTSVQTLSKKLQEAQLSPEEPCGTKIDTDANQASKDQTDYVRNTGYKMMHRIHKKKNSLSSAGNSNTVSSESNSYTSPSDSPDKITHETSRLDFLIDDEICDQPQLILNEKNEPIERLGSDHTISSVSSLQSSPSKSTISCSINELTSLKLKQAGLESPISPSNHAVEDKRTSSAAEIRHSNSFSGVRNSPHTFRQPRPVSVVESSDGTMEMDGSSKRSIMQDINGIKTLLFRLQGEIQNVI